MTQSGCPNPCDPAFPVRYSPGCRASTEYPRRSSDGIRSNSAMDGPGELGDRLREDYGPLLTPLTDPVSPTASAPPPSCLTPGGEPQLRSRAPRQSTFSGGFHFTDPLNGLAR